MDTDGNAGPLGQGHRDDGPTDRGPRQFSVFLGLGVGVFLAGSLLTFSDIFGRSWFGVPTPSAQCRGWSGWPGYSFVAQHSVFVSFS